MKKILLLILTSTFIACCSPDEDVIVDKPVTETPPVITETLKPAIVNITSYKKLTSKKTGKVEIDSTRQRLVYTIRKDKIDTEFKTYYRYDEKGRLTKIEENQGNEEYKVLRKFAYDDTDKITLFSDPNHYLTYCSFDVNGRIIGSHYNPNDTVDNETIITYDASNRVSTIVHTNGQSQTYEYDTDNTYFIIHYLLNNVEYLSQKNWYDNHKPGTYSLEKNNLYAPSKYMHVEFYQITDFRIKDPEGNNKIYPQQSTKRLYNKWGYLIQAYDEESNNVLVYVYECY
jgi:uncharacterized protein YcfL